MIIKAQNRGFNASTEKPSAFITNGKQRVKQYSNSVYLKNGDTFEIELFNPTHKTILAKIKINDEYVSSSGIILKPGQRIFLERFIDVDKKMVYSIYEVDGSNSTVLNAIKSNGNVQIEFYNEVMISNSYNQYWGTTSNSSISITPTINTGIGITSTDLWRGAYTTTNSIGSGTLNNLSNSITYSLTNDSTNTSLQTGRVESGDNSNQSILYNNNFTFEWYPSHTINWKIFPYSQKPIEVSDLKKYCHMCGGKIKKSTYKFCPNCGASID